MADATGSAPSSVIEDIMRLIPPDDRAAFRKMLQMELQGRELPNDELRQVAERTWHKFLKFGWPRA